MSKFNKIFDEDYLAYQGGITNSSILNEVDNATSKELKKMKEKMKEKGDYMLPVKAITKNITPNEKSEKKYMGLQMCLSYLDEQSTDKLMEIAKNIPDPAVLIDQAIAIQQYRVGMGMKEEQQKGYLVEQTESAIQNLVSMINAKKVITEGADVNLKMESSISSILEEIEQEENMR